MRTCLLVHQSAGNKCKGATLGCEARSCWLGNIILLRVALIPSVLCRYIYDGRMPFSEQPNSYKCPACSSTKKRFKAYKGNAGKRPRNDNKSMVARLRAREW